MGQTNALVQWEISMSKAFASTGDLDEKRISFDDLGGGAYAYTAEGDPNTGIVVGDDGVLVIDAQATPMMAERVLERVRSVTDKPVTHLVLSHYHAVRVLGAAAYGDVEIIASQGTRDLIEERGREDWESEFERFPRLFQGHDSIAGLTIPTTVFADPLTFDLGNRTVEIFHPGRGHTQGDTVVWLRDEKILFAGDLVEYGATPYCGDAHLTDWPGTLDALRALGPEKMVPGRGDALTTAEQCRKAMAMTEGFVRDLFATAQEGRAQGMNLKQTFDLAKQRMDPKYADWVIYEHCMPFNLARAYDEAGGQERPTVWTAERDKEMWVALNG